MISDFLCEFDENVRLRIAGLTVSVVFLAPLGAWFDHGGWSNERILFLSCLAVPLLLVSTYVLGRLRLFGYRLVTLPPLIVSKPYGWGALANTANVLATFPPSATNPVDVWKEVMLAEDVRVKYTVRTA